MRTWRYEHGMLPSSTCMYVYMYTYMLSALMSMYVCVYVCMYCGHESERGMLPSSACMYACVFVYVCMWLCVYVCMYCGHENVTLRAWDMYTYMLSALMWMYVCMYVCVYCGHESERGLLPSSICMYVCVCVCVYWGHESERGLLPSSICMYVCMCVCVLGTWERASSSVQVARYWRVPTHSWNWRRKGMSGTADISLSRASMGVVHGLQPTLTLTLACRSAQGAQGPGALGRDGRGSHRERCQCQCNVIIVASTACQVFKWLTEWLKYPDSLYNSWKFARECLTRKTITNSKCLRKAATRKSWKAGMKHYSTEVEVVL